MSAPASRTAPAQVRVFAPAKINWALTVEKKRQDGYHNIHTVFQTLSFGDELTVRHSSKPRCKVRCDCPEVPVGQDNLICKAWEILSQLCPGQVGGIDVFLEKRIPMGGGLGGGSSDAVAALVAMRKMFDLPMSLDDLAGPASRLGSDCAFFLRGGTAIGSGRGELLESIVNRLPDLTLVVVNPGFPSSTPRAYSLVRPCHYEDDRAVRRVAAAIGEGDQEKLNKSIKNVFDYLVILEDVRYFAIKDLMKQLGLMNPVLTGSGATMFAIAATRSQAKAAHKILLQHFPFVAVCKLRKAGVRVLPSRLIEPQPEINLDITGVGG